MATFRLLRLFRIYAVARRYGLDQIVREHAAQTRAGRWFARLWPRRQFSAPPEQRLRQALEALGPIFVKFGQMLSTRRDLLSPALADQLALLQDRVPPFAQSEVEARLLAAYGPAGQTVFRRFDWQPVASASVAQVHFGELPDGTEVAIKVLRPGIDKIISDDLALLQTAAGLIELLWADGRRLRPREVVAEFGRHLEDELDLMREAANCSQLRRNFLPKKAQRQLLFVPEIYWDYCHPTVMVMARMYGTPISQIDKLQAAGVDLKSLSRDGVEIFFTQVFRDSFFHADMHPGNILVATEGPQKGRYIALDFGIMGTLGERDKQYLAQNFLAFFKRDYRRVAQIHLDAGWVPASTRVDEFETAIRAVCEPIFDKPLKDISFGKTLLRLFQTARRFNMEVQPQLVMLQKTLLNIEGLGRQLDPDLDLWVTAKPFLERWMNEQAGPRALLRQLRDEAPNWATTLPQLPRLLHRSLNPPDNPYAGLIAEFEAKLRAQKRLNLALIIGLLLLAGLVFRHY